MELECKYSKKKLRNSKRHTEGDSWYYFEGNSVGEYHIPLFQELMEWLLVETLQFLLEEFLSKLPDEFLMKLLETFLIYPV